MTKNFEQSFVNEYLAWNLHDQDVLKKGKEQEKTETAKRMISKGFAAETISELTNLSVDIIQTLFKK